jgi:mono/diheme cytochrome c family protein
VNGGINMPAFGNTLKPEELAQITAFLQSRKRQLRAEDQSIRAESSSTSIAK